MGLVNNQIQLVHVNILLETMNLKPLHERPPENEHSSKFFESIKLDWPSKYVPRYKGSGNPRLASTWLR